MKLGGYFLAIKFMLFRRKIKKPDGINLLENLNIRNFERWSENNDYYTDYDVTLNNNLKLVAHPDTTVYFNWDTWDWSYEQKSGYTQKYTHSSGRCDTQDKVTIDVYKPGRIVSKCTTPQEGAVSAIWIYFEEHPHDAHSPDRDVYFELDIYETEPRKPEDRGSIKAAIFTHWLGKYQADASHQGVWLNKRLKGYHYPELSWDGKGNFVWKLDGVTVKKVSLNLPVDLKPYVIYTLGVASDLVTNSNSVVEWSVYEK